MAEQVTDVAQLLLDHGWPLKTETPSDNIHILRETHGSEHLGAEDTRVSEFDPLLEVRMIAEDLERGLGVRVVGRLELDIGDTNLIEEDLDNTYQVTEANILVGNETFALMELSKMSGIKSLVTEDTIDREMLDRLELLLLSQVIKHLRTNGGGVSTQQILRCLLFLPLSLVTLGSEATL